jgi:hypothetical protein
MIMGIRRGRSSRDITRMPILGEGGEATIHDMGDGTVAKIFKRPDHPDYAASTAAQESARQRIEEHQHKLRAFPRSAPPRVVAPAVLIDDGAGQVIGYIMPRIDGAEVLLRYGERSFCDGRVSDNDVVAVFRSLHATTVAAHRAGIIIGDFNDLNVLVRGSDAWLIDADSMQYGAFSCRAYTERFLDPLLADDRLPAPVLVRPYNTDADWYAFTALLMQSLLYVGPYGGVHRPPSAAARVAQAARPLHRLSVFHPDVRYPRPARPWMMLPDDLVSHFQSVFERDHRGDFPYTLLDSLRWTGCSSCGAMHARATCPSCTTPHPSVVTTTRVRGRVVATRVRTVPPQPRTRRHWVEGGALWRDDAAGPLRIGSVAGSTQVWTGPAFGFGFYRLQEMTVAFVFDARATGLNDGVRIPRIAGQLISAHAVLSDRACWFVTRTQEQARTVRRLAVILRDGTVAATATDSADEPWWDGLGGACAAGESLFVPADGGIVRLSYASAGVHVAASFPDTEPFIHAGQALLAGPDGLYVVAGTEVTRLVLS